MLEKLAGKVKGIPWADGGGGEGTFPGRMGCYGHVHGMAMAMAMPWPLPWHAHGHAMAMAMAHRPLIHGSVQKSDLIWSDLLI